MQKTQCSLKLELSVIWAVSWSIIKLFSKFFCHLCWYYSCYCAVLILILLYPHQYYHVLHFFCYSSLENLEIKYFFEDETLKERGFVEGDSLQILQNHHIVQWQFSRSHFSYYFCCSCKVQINFLNLLMGSSVTFVTISSCSVEVSGKISSPDDSCESLKYGIYFCQ